MEIDIKTLTPLWTGGVEAGKCDRIHETGILGSLRWWMEVLVRGLGGQVNDPTSEERSSFDAEKYKKSKATNERQRLCEAGLCDVSQIFGATGWKQRFRLEVEDNTSTIQFRDEYANNRFLTAREGEFKIKIKIQSLDSAFDPKIIGGLIQFIADWSALGARPQMGFGVITIVDACINGKSILQSGRIPTQSLYNWLTAATKTKPGQTLPSLKNIFLAKITVPHSPTKQDTFKRLKSDLHQLFANDQQLHDFIMGTAQGKRMAAKVKISRPYSENGTTVMRVWGWIPETAKLCSKDGHEEKDLYTNGWNREKVVDVIYQHLAANYTLLDWREMNSPRDKITPDETDAKVFLHSLFESPKFGRSGNDGGLK